MTKFLNRKVLFCSCSFLRASVGREFTNAYSSAINIQPTVSIVGSGPAAFGIAQFLLKNHTTIRVNMIEKNPVPYGLVRYGVSPDHQDVKNCVHGYEKVAQNPRMHFYGGVEVGKAISLDDLMQVSDSIVLCYGAQEPSKLGISGEDVSNVFTAKEFVGWYNGEEEHYSVNPDLSGDTAVIVGVGNVALDCARILLKPTNQLKETDITQNSFKKLLKSNIKNVILVGRRGPLQMACTRRELSEIVELENVRTNVSTEYFTDNVMEALQVKKLSLRKSQRLVKYLLKSNQNIQTKAQKNFTVNLLKTPTHITGSDSVTGLLLCRNFIQGGDAFNPDIVKSNIVETIPCSMVITAIGYGNKIIDDRIPSKYGRVLTTAGRVDFSFPIYACGWSRTGPKGVLADTLNDCLVTGGNMIEDLESSCWTIQQKSFLEDILTMRKIQWYSWKNWRRIDAHEIKMGSKLGKIREKIIYHSDMAKIGLG